MINSPYDRLARERRALEVRAKDGERVSLASLVGWPKAASPGERIFQRGALKTMGRMEHLSRIAGSVTG